MAAKTTIFKAYSKQDTYNRYMVPTGISAIGREIDPVDPAPSPYHLFHRRERQHLVLSAADTLSKKQRKIIHLTMADFTMPEIRVELHCSRQAVHQGYNKALKTLQKRFNQ